MPLPVVGLFPWLIGLVASGLGSVFTWIVAKFAAEKAIRIVVVSGFLLTAFGMMVTVALGVKLLILSVQVSMPAGLGNSTFFLPSNINVIMGAYFTMRVSYYLYKVSVYTLTAYVHGLPGTPP